MLNNSQLSDIKESIRQLPEIHQAQYHSWLKKLLSRAKRKQPIDRSLTKLHKQLQVDLTNYQKRAKNRPKAKLNQALPIYDRREQIVEHIQQNQVVVIAGETGSGKTTQLPQLCLEAGLGNVGLIGHTQPRRIAATAVANRIADELGCQLGNEVGYQIRFDKNVSETTYIKLMTDGVLLNELHEDPLLNKYEVLIVDEAHERSLNIDFILGIVKGILEQRPKFKLLITSATIDLDKFSKHFNDAPIIEVSGRTYPVEMRYRPESHYTDIDSFEQHALAAVRELSREGAGDILVFLPSEQAIRHLADFLRRHLQKQYDILPLYSRLAKQQQMTIFQGHSKSRIVLATNIAETSLTVPGIRYVIDSGLARISRYSTRSKVQRLPIEAISQASANQRAGRCGRVAAGICIRLYSEEDFSQRPEYVEPEILRTNLATVILQMAQLDLGAVEQFDFIDPPLQKQINDGIQLLIELQAMQEGREITALGQKLARLPVDPRIGRILIAAAENNALREVTIIAAMIGIQDPRERPSEAQQKADENHSRFKDKRSDFLSLLKLWQYFESLVDEMSWNQVRKRCIAEFIHYQRMREWREHVSQLLHIMRGLGYEISDVDANYDAIHKSLLSGFLTQIAQYDPRGYYVAPRQVKLHIFPASGLYRKPPRKKPNEKSPVKTEPKANNVAWIMAAEWVETSKNFARLVAEIKPEWVETFATGLLKLQQSEPYWSSKGGRAMVKESGLLFGLAIYANRRKPLAQFDSKLAHELFVQHGLVDKGFTSRAKPLQENWQLVAEAEEIQYASRQHDLIIGRDWFVNWYQQRVPRTIHNAAQFDKWCNNLKGAERKSFCYSLKDICDVDLKANRNQFPDTIQVGSIELAVEYRFEPGQTSDGIHILIPLIFLNQVQPADFQWLVPGLFEELIIALIRTLPKAKRKRFVPVPDYARALIERLQPELSGNLYEQMASGLQRMSGELMSADDFDVTNLPHNLLPTYVVLDDDETVLESSSNLETLQSKYRSKVQQSVKSADTTELYEHIPQTGIEFSSELQRGVGSLTIYSGLKLADKGYQLVKSDDESQIRFWHEQSIISLVIKDSQKLIRDMTIHIPEIKPLQMIYASLKGTEQEQTFFDTDNLIHDLLTYSIRKQLSSNNTFVSDKETYYGLLKLVNSSVIPDAIDLLSPLKEALTTLQSIRKQLNNMKGMEHLSVVTAIRKRLEELCYCGFIHISGEALLRQYPRYLKSIVQRLETAVQKPLQERQRSVIWDEYWGKYCALPSQAKTLELRESLEEFHVMTFAQQLGTKKKVSEKRLKKLLVEHG